MSNFRLSALSFLTLTLAACSTLPTPGQSSSGSRSLSSQALTCAAWSATTAYNAGDTASAGGVTYKANWWTQGDAPATHSGPSGSGQPWSVISGTCGTTSPGGDTTAPSVSLSASPTSVTTAGNVSLSASASDNVGVSKVEFYQGSTLLSTDTTAPYTASEAVTSAQNGTRSYTAKAFDAAGNTKSASASVTVNISTTTPPPPPSTGLAKHALIGYWHNFTNPSGDTFPISDVPNTWDVIVVAFAENASGGNASFVLDPKAGGEAKFISDIRAKQSQGKKVVLSLGGQNGSVSVASQTEADNFSNSLFQIITRYGFNGIDLDLESGVSSGAAIQTYLPIAVKQLKAKLGTGSNFYLSMAPEWVYVEGGYSASGGPWGAYIPIIDALRSDLTVLHPQYYNNGSIYTPYRTQPYEAGSTDQLVATARMLIEGFPYGGKTFAGLRPDQVAFGVPSGPSSAGSGFTTPSNVNNALDCLTRLVNCGTLKPLQAYPTLRGVMTWSINWDKHDGFNFSAPVSAKLRSLP